MENRTYKLSFEILQRLDKEGILQNFTLVGSWCVYFYRDYFKSKAYISTIWTRDMDIAISRPVRLKKKLNMVKLFEEYGFIPEYKGDDGYLRLNHPELIVEFLVNEKGKGMDGPFKIPELNINAQPLRFIEYLITSSIRLKSRKLWLRLPHPAAYALHKFLILDRRRDKEKSEKDLESAKRVFTAIIKKKEQEKIYKYFKLMHEKWQKKVISNLIEKGENEIAGFLIKLKNKHTGE
ncbi:MAG TPA: GSU2403 family nucleotidyltransferase fold protein [Candidatus Goldiibacteriota bacterium]|nr:GSU2403 family nucleotidyltransferase fold protein [Candidatus Goldiibacteriota bacterium]HPI02493.1 GSU2403 family nucleotidyltransferase fold protein [Candidatus Goldiibacteriota bacterium]HPN64831.1 GSU2403 family nucleotidyltransferase fold protein [Candidatus Goldiibacteriota bacterium]HRQ44586.1 GSU2403 family nucleotidyltransferase fold protein [Candidatus Goldiibacteriota bacterium]